MKKVIFQMKKVISQNIDLRQLSSNKYTQAKMKVYPCKPKFYNTTAEFEIDELHDANFIIPKM